MCIIPLSIRVVFTEIFSKQPGSLFLVQGYVIAHVFCKTQYSQRPNTKCNRKRKGGERGMEGVQAKNPEGSIQNALWQLCSSVHWPLYPRSSHEVRPCWNLHWKQNPTSGSNLRLMGKKTLPSWLLILRYVFLCRWKHKSTTKTLSKILLNNIFHYLSSLSVIS